MDDVALAATASPPFANKVPSDSRLTLLAQPVQLAEIATAAMWQARRGEASSPQKDFRSPKDKALFNGKQINSQLVT